MEEELASDTFLRRSMYPFFFGAFLVGLGVGNMFPQNEYMSIILVVLGGALGMYSASMWKGYRIEVTARRRSG